MLHKNLSRKSYKAPPTSAAFHQSNARIKAIMGPFRSGKTVTMTNEIYRQGKAQHPDSDGVRKSRWLVSRETSGELATTTMDTWFDWFPAPYSQIRRTAPMKGTYRERLADGTRLELYLMFMPLEDAKKAKATLKGTDLTGAWMNEASEWEKKDVFDFINGRIGSYPAVKDNGRGNRQTSLLLDFNPPPTTHWLYKTFEEERPFDHILFKQPSALLRDPLTGLYRPNPHAENIENLGQGTMTIEPGHPMIEAGTYHKGYEYYFGQLAGSDPDKIKVNVMNEYGAFYTGDKVFSNYNDRVHFSEEPIFPSPSVMLGMGQDVGYHNATVFGQMIDGRVHIFDELYRNDMTVEEYIEDALSPRIRENFHWVRRNSQLMITDPTSETRAFTDGRRPFDLFDEAGIPIEPAYTNDPLERVNAVDHYLRKMIKGQPALVLGPRCVMLRQAFLGGYQYKGKGDKRKPDKSSEFAHIMDALQYLCLYYLNGVGQRRSRETDKGWGTSKRKPYLYA